MSIDRNMERADFLGSKNLTWNERLAQRYAPAPDYQGDPALWAVNVAQEFMWSKQVEIMESVRDNRYTAVPSAHDMGKSFIASRIMAWWIDTHAPGDAFVVSTAPTAAQVSAILWREISKIHGKAKLQGRILRAGYPQWVVGSELIGYGRKPADYEESAFQGIHARFVLIVMDEACGIAKHLFDAVDSLATNEHARVLAIGNPDDPGSHFAAICKPGSGWNVIHLDGLRSPNITKARVIGHKSDGYGYARPKYPLLAALMAAEHIPYSTEKVPEGLNEMLVSELWIEERIQRWAGVTVEQIEALTPDETAAMVTRRCAASPIFTAKVRGQFPTAGTEGVIPLGWIQLAINRWHDVMDNHEGVASLAAHSPGRKVIGVDVAGEGSDETAFAIRYGNVVEKLVRFRNGLDTMEIADEVAFYMDETDAVAVVDVIGIGAGVYARLNQMRKYPATNPAHIVGRAVPFNASATSHKLDETSGEFRFRNDRSAAWWRMRELLDPSRGSNICLPDDERLLQELSTVRYKHNVGGIIQVETKEEIRKRIGRSTDTADAVIQSLWVEGKTAPAEGYEYDYTGRATKKTGQSYGGYSGFTELDMNRSLGENRGFGETASELDDWINS